MTTTTNNNWKTSKLSVNEFQTNERFYCYWKGVLQPVGSPYFKDVIKYVQKNVDMYGFNEAKLYTIESSLAEYNVIDLLNGVVTYKAK